jgi:SAM-dependent methyltransferase
VFVPPKHYISREEEKAEYDRHQNRPDDPGYRQFLSRLFLPLRERLSPGSQGLDFGSGPGPTLSVMLTEAGHDVTLYDRFYAHFPAVLARRYDFITASEVVEHLHHPGFELDRLYRLLKPGGLLGIMTKQVIDRAKFASWHYKNDFTHVCFFSPATFVWLAEKWHAQLDMIVQDVIIIRKPAAKGRSTKIPDAHHERKRVIGQGDDPHDTAKGLSDDDNKKKKKREDGDG